MVDDQKFLSDFKAELESTPQLLYKYCNIATAEKILGSAAFTLSSPRRFNDPFDTCFQMLPPSEEKLREMVDQYTTKPVKRLEMRNKARRKFKLHKGKILPDVERSINKMGISCFSETRGSILMWAHYADSHSGVCLGFNGTGLREHLFAPIISEMLRLNISPKQAVSHFPKAIQRTLRKVNYVDEFPIFPIGSWDINDADIFRKKSKIWAYEEEWRIISCFGENADRKLQDFPKEILAEIIFGVNAKQETIKRIRTLADKGGYPTEFIQAKQSATKYEIEFVPCPN